jgi:hypothetical protein
VRRAEHKTGVHKYLKSTCSGQVTASRHWRADRPARVELCVEQDTPCRAIPAKRVSRGTVGRLLSAERQLVARTRPVLGSWEASD